LEKTWQWMTFRLAQEISIFQLSQTVFEEGWFRTSSFSENEIR